jgi:predicted transcriptional regulator
MDPDLRQRLDDLAEDLTQPEVPAADAVHDEVRRAIDEGSAHGLGERIEAYLVDLETDHPALASVLRTLVDDLSAMGL